MAITSTLLPAIKSSAYLPIVFECTSDRNNSASLAITSVASSGGDAKFTVASNSQFKVNNVVKITGCTEPSYNGTFLITADTSTSFTIDVPYVATDTGTATITNNNFKIKGELYVFDQAKFSITGITDLGGGVIQVTTSAPHGYNTSDIVFIRATTNYNDRYTVILSPTTTTFDIVATYVSSQTGNVQEATLIGTKYQSDISVNGVNLFRFAFQGMLQSCLSFNLYTTYPAAVQTDPSNCIKVYCVLLTEVYDDPDGTTAEHATLLTPFRYAMNTTLQHEEAQTFTDYQLGSSTKKFLTDSPASQDVRIGEEVQLHFLGASGVTYKVASEQFDNSGSSLGVSYTSTFTLVDDRGVFCVNQNNVLSASIKKVDVWIVNTSNTQLSEKKTFVMITKQIPFYRRFYFFNIRGGFDTFTFGGSYISTGTRKKNMFMRSRPLNFAVTDRGAMSLSTRKDVVSSIWSRMLTNAESVWLEQLFDNNMTFLLESEGSTVFIPVNVADDTTTIETSDGAPVMKKIAYEKSNLPIIQVN